MDKEKIKNLINSAKITIFIKGTPQQPQCGFSMHAIEILNNYTEQYVSHDILKDMELRQDLKEYSNWPTYPQLYVEGELIGGFDIMQKLHQQGKLKEILKL